jgi:hypothetical protein
MSLISGIAKVILARFAQREDTVSPGRLASMGFHRTLVGTGMMEALINDKELEFGSTPRLIVIVGSDL